MSRRKIRKIIISVLFLLLASICGYENKDNIELPKIQLENHEEKDLSYQGQAYVSISQPTR